MLNFQFDKNKRNLRPELYYKDYHNLTKLIAPAFYLPESYNNNGKKYIVDYCLEYLETILNPKMFYRIIRKYYVSFHACKNIISYTNSRLKIKIDALKDEELMVSRERVSDFKNWLDS